MPDLDLNEQDGDKKGNSGTESDKRRRDRNSKARARDIANDENPFQQLPALKEQLACGVGNCIISIIYAIVVYATRKKATKVVVKVLSRAGRRVGAGGRGGTGTPPPPPIFWPTPTEVPGPFWVPNTDGDSGSGSGDDSGSTTTDEAENNTPTEEEIQKDSVQALEQILGRPATKKEQQNFDLKHRISEQRNKSRKRRSNSREAGKVGGGEEHTSNKRNSNEEKHQGAESRRARDQRRRERRLR